LWHGALIFFYFANTNLNFGKKDNLTAINSQAPKKVPRASYTIQIINQGFFPNPLILEGNKTFKWVNESNKRCTISGGRFRTKTLLPQQSSKAFQAGTNNFIVEYFCKENSKTKGKIIRRSLEK